MIAQNGGKCGTCGYSYKKGDEISVISMGARTKKRGLRGKKKSLVLGCPNCLGRESVRVPGLPGWILPKNEKE